MTLSNELIIDLLRHGEPQGDQQIFRGRTDDPLSAVGWQQMKNTIGEHRPWDTIVCSPAIRCARFAENLAVRLSLPIEQDEQLWELDFGKWDGKPFSDIKRSSPELLSRFWHDPVKTTPPGGEPLLQFQQRILNAWNQLQHNSQGKHCLIITHSGPIRVIIGYILGIPLNSLLTLELPYACLSRIRVYFDNEHSVTGSSLVFHNGALS